MDADASAGGDQRRFGGRSVTVVIPAHNEAERVRATVGAAKGLPGVTEIIVVDDGSRDQTSGRALLAGAKVIRARRNRGKGWAMERGWRWAEGETIVFLDADLGDSAAEAAALVEPVVAGRADLTIATLPRGPNAGGLGLVVGLARLGLARLAGWEATDPLCGQRAVSRRLLDDIGGLEDGFGAEVAMTIDAITRGYRVREVPTRMTHRLTGRSLGDVRHRFRQLVDVAAALIVRWRWRG
ncbi:MAG: glycosyltransferase family 2 protein [Bacillota bacterium]